MNLNMLSLLGSGFDNVDRDAIKEISRKTNMVTSIILIIVGAVFLIFVVYLVYLHITTKKPKRSAERFREYKTAEAKIIGIEKVPYYVQPYTPKPEKTEYLQVYERHGRSLSFNKANAEKNKMLIWENASKSWEQPWKSVEKSRYKVRYEFSTNSNNLYSGECFVYEESEDIQVGKTIEIKYDPTNPMVNFSAYSAPVGTR